MESSELAVTNEGTCCKSAATSTTLNHVGPKEKKQGRLKGEGSRGDGPGLIEEGGPTFSML